MENKIVTILRENFAQYEKSHRITKYVIKVIYQILKCRTIDMGGHAHECPECGFIEIWYNSCRNRSCPQCSHIRIEEWLEKQKKKLLNMEHYHIIFTIPEEINPFFLRNKKELTNLLFKCSNETIEYFMKDPKWLGANTGRILTLHTWSQTLILHPHIHCLMSAGGLSKDNKLVLHNRKYLAPVKAMRNVFRAKFLKEFQSLIKTDKIDFPINYEVRNFKLMINSIYKKKWVVFIKEKYAYGKGIAVYLSNYVKGGPMKQSRITSYSSKYVSFKYRDPNRKNKKSMKKNRIMTLSMSAFIQRYLLHIPYPRQNVIRYYGLYSPKSILKLNLTRMFLNQELLEPNSNLETTDCEVTDDDKLSEIRVCPICESDMVSHMNLRKKELRWYVFRKKVYKPPDRLKSA